MNGIAIELIRRSTLPIHETETGALVRTMMPAPQGVGDLTPLGWVAFLAYFGVAVLCYRAASICWRDGVRSRRSCRFWLALAAILVLLGVNKQLDFHLWLNAVGRNLAVAEGWYQNRWVAQVTFLAGISIVLVALCLVLLWQAWGNLGRLSGALLGLAALAAFMLIRAISFDVVDLRTAIGGIMLHEILEALGILLIGVAAMVFARAPD